jgi:hypothetical protein
LNRNVLLSCKYRVVFCPKYRHSVLMPPIDVRLRRLIQHVCDETQSGLIEMEVMPDQVHLLLDWDPQFGIHRLGAGHQGSDIAYASVGISGVANTPANTLDEQLFRQHRGRRAARSDQAIYRESEARLMRTKTSSLVAELPHCTTAADEAALPIRLDAERNICNASLGESLRRLDLMRESLDWQRARSMPAMLGTNAKGKQIPNKEQSDLFKATQVRFGFSSASIQKFAETCRDACWIGEHLGSHDTQTTSLRAVKAVQQYAFGERGRPRFKGVRRLHSVEGKADAVISGGASARCALVRAGADALAGIEPGLGEVHAQQTRLRHREVARHDIDLAGGDGVQQRGQRGFGLAWRAGRQLLRCRLAEGEGHEKEGEQSKAK